VKSREILDLLQSLQRGLKKTILLVTHDPVAAARARRVLRIDKGLLVEDRADNHAWNGDSVIRAPQSARERPVC
jgi:ABC-type lipoprotein export system ATPase subunit